MEVRPGFYRYYLGVGSDPHARLEMLNADLPSTIKSNPVSDFSIVVDVDTAGKVIAARIPNLSMAAPLVEEALRVARIWEFKPLDLNGMNDCSASYRFDFKLPNPGYDSEPQIFVDREEVSSVLQQLGWSEDVYTGPRKFGY